MKKNGTFLRSFAKKLNVLAFFPVLYKKMGRSLRSLGKIVKNVPFFCKERDVLYNFSHSFEKNGKKHSVPLGLISSQKLNKRTGKNGTFFKRVGNSRTF